MVILAPCRGVELALGGGERHSFDAPTGTILLNPAGRECTMSWQSVREEVVVAISEGSLSELAQQVGVGGPVALAPPPLVTLDRAALRIARVIKAELQQGSPADISVDSLIALFGVHLLRNYARADPSRGRTKGALSAARARRLQEYVDHHLERKLSVAELASICGLSPGHFIRAFKRTFGQRPHEYLLNRRLALAERLLADDEMTIAEVAHRSGFSSQSHLTSSMRKYRNTTPARLRSGRDA